MLGMFLLPAFTHLGMNVRIFEFVRWNACVQRLDLGLYSHPKEFFGGMESEPMLTPREISPLPEKVSSEEGPTHDAASSRTASPTHYPRAILAPVPAVTLQLMGPARVTTTAPAFKPLEGLDQGKWPSIPVSHALQGCLTTRPLGKLGLQLCSKRLGIEEDEERQVMDREVG